MLPWNYFHFHFRNYIINMSREVSVFSLVNNLASMASLYNIIKSESLWKKSTKNVTLKLPPFPFSELHNQYVQVSFCIYVVFYTKCTYFQYIQMAIFKHLYLISSGVPRWRKAFGICAESLLIRTDFFHRVRWKNMQSVKST